MNTVTRNKLKPPQAKKEKNASGEELQIEDYSLGESDPMHSPKFYSFDTAQISNRKSYLNAASRKVSKTVSGNVARPQVKATAVHSEPKLIDNQIDKHKPISEQGRKKYRYIELANGMEVLLISSKECPDEQPLRSSCTYSVNDKRASRKHQSTSVIIGEAAKSLSGGMTNDFQTSVMHLASQREIPRVSKKKNAKKAINYNDEMGRVRRERKIKVIHSPKSQFSAYDESVRAATELSNLENGVQALATSTALEDEEQGLGDIDMDDEDETVVHCLTPSPRPSFDALDKSPSYTLVGTIRSSPRASSLYVNRKIDAAERQSFIGQSLDRRAQQDTLSAVGADNHRSSVKLRNTIGRGIQYNQADIVASQSYRSQFEKLADEQALTSSARDSTLKSLSPNHTPPTLRDYGSLRSQKTIYSVYPSTTLINDANVVPNANEQIKMVKMAYVSLAVSVGSFTEHEVTPHNLYGLAHLLEHMLFMGSDDFPSVNEFDSLISGSGGTSNAYTDAERTVYHFSCPQEHLDKILHVFSSFFVNPTLNPSMIDTELGIINEEARLRQNNEDCRRLEICRATSNPSTPFARFTCGTKDTLARTPDQAQKTYRELRRFFETFYAAPNMRLVIEAGLDLNELQDMANHRFGRVKNTNPRVPEPLSALLPWRIGKYFKRRTALMPLKTPEIISFRNMLYDADKALNHSDELPAGQDGASLSCIFRHIPIHQSHEVFMLWQLPPQEVHRHVRATDLISTLLGHGCSGSILMDAKAKGWISNLTVSAGEMEGFEDNELCNIFTLTAVFTEAGLLYWKDFVGMVFQYIRYIEFIASSESEEEPSKLAKLFDEINMIYYNRYHYSDDSDEASKVQELSACMLPQRKFTTSRDRKEVLDKGLVLPFEKEDWNSNSTQIVMDILALMVPELTRIDIASSSFQTVDEDEDDLPPTGADTLRLNDITKSARANQKSKSQTTSKKASSHLNFNNIAKNILKPKRKVLKSRKNEDMSFTSAVDNRDSDDNAESQDSDGRFKAFECTPFDAKKHVLLKAEHTDTEYYAERVDDKLLEAWEHCRLSKLPENFGWPLENIFIPSMQDLAIQDLDDWESIIPPLQVHVHPASGAKKGAIIPLIMRNKAEQKQFILLEDEKFGVRQWYQLRHSEVDVQHTNSPFHTLAATIVKKGTPANPALSEVLYQRSQPEMERIEKFPFIPPKQDQMLPVLTPESDHLLAVWHLQDRSKLGRLPRGEIRCRITSPSSHSTVKQATLNDLLGMMINDSLREIAYLYGMAEVEMSLDSFDYGHTISCYGFSHKVPLLFKSIFKQYIEFASIITKKSSEREKAVYALVPKVVFESHLSTLNFAFCNEGAQLQAAGVLSAQMYRVLILETFEPEAKTSAAQNISLSDFIEYAGKFLSRCKIEVFVAGNFDFEDARNIHKAILEELDNVKSLALESLPKHEMRKLKRQGDFSRPPIKREAWGGLSGLLLPLEATEYTGHSVDLYYHFEQDTTEKRAAAELIQQIMQEPLYKKLRTEKGLGYIVKCSVIQLYGNLGFMISLASSKVLPHILADEVDAFLQDFLITLDKMTSEQFTEYTVTLAKKKVAESSNFGRIVDRHWETILSAQDYCLNEYNEPNYQWNNHFKMVEMMRKPTFQKKHLLNIYEQYLRPSSPDRMKASVVIFGLGYQTGQLVDPRDELAEHRDFIDIYPDDVKAPAIPQLRKKKTSLCTIM